MPTTSDGRKFPYTADGIAAAAAHERSLKANRKKMGKGKPGNPEMQKKTYNASMLDRMNDASAAQMNTLSGGLLYPKEGPKAYKRAKARGDMS